MAKRSLKQPRLRRIAPAAVFAIVGVAVVVAVGLANRALNGDFGPSPTAIATPGPNAGEPAVQLAAASTVGKAAFPSGDAAAGGHGQAVDDISCAASEFATMHIHSHLALFVRGKQLAIPDQIGIPHNGAAASCIYWVHTHDATGIIHVESPIVHTFTIGQFFDIWGEPLERSRVTTASGEVRAFVNGSEYEGNLASIPLTAHQEITLEIGPPYVPPPRYLFPSGY